MDKVFFTVTHSNGKKGPRTGVMNTAYGTTETPCFMPIASNGSFRSLTFDQIDQLDIKLIMANAWHVYREHGPVRLREIGGIHKILGWNHLICTDSGGYQAFSLRDTCYITEKGVVFGKGDNETLTPLKVIEIQKELGSDIMIALDDCAPYPCTKERALEAVQRTKKWGLESVVAHKQIESPYGLKQQLYGIIQGSTFNDLRIQSSHDAGQLDFDGYGIGGLSIGMTQSQAREMTAICTENLPFHKPRHLLGVGLPIQVLYGIDNGVDTFDCVLPLRKAQRGVVYTSGGEVYYKHVQPEYMKNEPLDPLCSCTTCQNYTREQLRQLFKTDKVKAGELASIHNIYFYNDMMKNARIAIQENRFDSYLKGYITRWLEGGGTISE
jgi:queuine tRNA-ribosyltransferase